MQDLLFLAHRIPYPPNKGDKLRSYHLLKYLSTRYRVHLGSFVDDRSDWEHVGKLKEICGDTYFAPLRPSLRKLISLTALLLGEPLSLRYYHHGGMRSWVNAVVRRRHIRRVLVFSSVMAQYVLDFEDARRVADMVDVDSAKWAQYAKQKPWPISSLYAREGRRLLSFERDVAVAFDATTFVSEAEKALFESLSGMSSNRIGHSANGVDTSYFDPNRNTVNPFLPNDCVLVFTGAMDYWPNVDAVQWFVTDVFPLVRGEWPNIRFAIVGAKPTREVQELGNRPGVSVIGSVPDIRPYLAHARAVIAPLRIARGVQNKVLEGMAMGKPVIASPAAAQGIDAEAGRELLVAENARDYVEAIRSVLHGSCEVGALARTRVLESYSWEHNLSRVREMIEGSFDAIGSSEPSAVSA